MIIFTFLQVLCNVKVAWQSFQGYILPNAIMIGYTVDGDKLYMGRALIDGTLTPGKVIILITLLIV